MCDDPAKWPTEVAIHRIITAPDHYEASRIRNQVAMAAMRGHRPQRDADACTDAFFDRWSDEVRRQAVAKTPPLYWTGD